MQQIRQSQADILTQVQDLLREVQVLTGRFEESRFFTDKLLNETTAEMEVLKTKVETTSQGLSKKDAEELINRVKNIEVQMKNMDERLAAIEKVVEVPAPDDEATPTDEAKTPEELYEQALDVFNKRKYEEARRMMEGFIKANPDHKLAGNAQFWVGDSFYAEKQYADAILAYEDLLQKYKGHDKIPAALLKQAYAFLEMGDEKAAKGILRELTANHPESEQAKTAQEKLDSMEGKKKIAPPKTPAKPAASP
jgi:tol-pal system protein YbgF